MALRALDLVAQLGQRLFRGMHEVLGLIARIHQFMELAILFGMGLGIPHHAVDLIITQTRGGLDHDGLLFAGRLVLGGYVENTVGIDIERHLDLRHAARCRRNIGQIETSQRFVPRGHVTLALEHVYRHRGLIVVGRGKYLGCLGGYRGVLVDQPGHHPTQGFDTQRQRGYIQQQDILYLTTQHAALNGGTDGHRFIGIDVFTGFFIEKPLHSLLDLGHAGLPSHQDHIADVTD